MLKDFFFLAGRNITHRKLRSWLTVIGIFIGITAVVALISIGLGLDRTVKQEVAKVFGVDTFLITGEGFFQQAHSGDEEEGYQIDPESRKRLEQAASEHKEKLGKRLSLAFPLRKRNGCAMQLVNGIVVAADEAPARVVPTGIHWTYASLGSVDSALGLPLTNEHIDDQGRAVVRFEHGTILWKGGRGWVEWQ